MVASYRPVASACTVAMSSLLVTEMMSTVALATGSPVLESVMVPERVIPPASCTESGEGFAVTFTCSICAGNPAARTKSEYVPGARFASVKSPFASVDAVKATAASAKEPDTSRTFAPETGVPVVSTTVPDNTAVPTCKGGTVTFDKPTVTVCGAAEPVGPPVAMV